MNPKEKLYYLLNGLKNNTYDIKSFSDEFSRIYNLELDYDSLDNLEHELFRELSTVADRYSPYPEDLETKAFFTEQQVKNKALEVWEQLKKNYLTD